MNVSGSTVNEFSYFLEVHNTFKRDNEGWLLEQLKDQQGKNEEISKQLRSVGNEHFIKKDYRNCYFYYCKSLCNANQGSENYGLALANRSALLYELGDLENCLKDIDLCLKTKYPQKLYPKILLRKCYCLHRQEGKESINLKESIQTALNTIENCNEISPKQKGMYKQKFENIHLAEQPKIPQNLWADYKLPCLKNGENENFAYASSAIEIQYEKSRGRHVIAKENLDCGDVLFIEKAFFVAPAFTSKSKELPLDKCYHCLKDLRFSVPCLTCSICLYCNEDCRYNSWLTDHKWECVGMQANIWYGLGIGFAAFKAICKGFQSKFSDVGSMNITQFGSKTDNYPYFNTLLSHLDSKEHIDSMALIASKTIIYLKQCTSFFEDLQQIHQKQPVKFIGGLLLRHMCQIACNASVIEHWRIDKTDTLPKSSAAVAGGMFPSIGMMNHSCKPNVTLFYVGDIAIVKALDKINKGEEVFNCYGINYQWMDKKGRQKRCRDIYNFTCNCTICSDPAKEFHLLDNLKCPFCGQEFPSDMFSQSCNKCKKLLSDFSRLEFESQFLLENDNVCLEDIRKSQVMGKKIFCNTHMYFTRLYEAFYRYYLKNDDLKNAVKYVKLLLENESTRMGENSHSVGLTLLEILSEISSYVKINSVSISCIEDEVELLKSRCIRILQLYYAMSQESMYKLLSDNIKTS